MLAAVTGASGHAGANLVRALLDDGWRVRALVRSDVRALEGLEIDQAPAELFAPAALAGAFAGADVVFHLAGAISVSGDRSGVVERVNVDGTRNVIAACHTAKVGRLVHFSSVHALDHQGPVRVIDEARALARSGTAYDQTKARAEALVAAACAERGLDTVVVAPTGIIGPQDHKPSPMGRFLLTMFRGRLPAVVRGAYDFVDARDVALGAIAAAKFGRTGERYILGAHHRSIQNLSDLAAELSARRPPRWAAPMWLARFVAPAAESLSTRAGIDPLLTRESLAVLASGHHYSHSRARDELGWAPRPFRDTVVDTHAWFSQAGRL